MHPDFSRDASKQQMLYSFKHRGGRSQRPKLPRTFSPVGLSGSQVSSCQASVSSPHVLTPSPRPLHIIPPEGTPTLKWLNNSSSTGIGTSVVNHICIDTGRNIEAASNSYTALSPAEKFKVLEKYKTQMESNLKTWRSAKSQEGYSSPWGNGESSGISMNDENRNLALIPVEQSPVRYDYNDRESPSEVVSHLTSSKEAKARTSSHERLRRAKITEGIKLLQDSMPFSNQSNRDSVLDDVIDYIKFLKLQIKLLSQSRLGGEASSYPLIQLEGYGHYLLHPRISSEPLEEMVGELMERDAQAAKEMLESKGLTVLPCDLAYTLLQST